MYIAMGPSSELEYPLILSDGLEYIDEKCFLELLSELLEIRRILLFTWEG